MPDLDIVVPVFDEEQALERSVRRLHSFLSDGFPFSWRIVVTDNASTDATPRIARRLVAELSHVEVLRLEDKGRGRALRAAWSSSPARVVAYMDVDLSTDLRALLPLVARPNDGRVGSRSIMSYATQVGTKVLTTNGSTLYDLKGQV
jgi:glycosyltransferase involved in cell wall biosynthesis